MTYYIDVKNANIKDFLEVIQSLKELGIIESVNSNKELVQPGEALNEDSLLNILEHSKKEIKKGNSFTMEDVKQQIESWKSK